MPALQVGDEAPDFDLPALIAGVKKRFRLSEHRGKKNIVLAFYPFNWDPVSDRQMMALQLDRAAFVDLATETVAISVESIMNTTVWEREIGPFDFPMCSDFWPHGAVAQRYGVLRTTEPAAGACARAVFIVNRDGGIAFRRVYDVAEVPPIQETLTILQRI
jgi:peroxiredoxin (alkyl hydroperoxide reductase subunit C)